MGNFSQERQLLLSLSDQDAKEVLRLAVKGAALAEAWQPAASRTADRAYQRLQQLVGLRPTKDTIAKILAFHKMQGLAAARGKNIRQVSRHMCFSGNPGTAKTTVARLCAEIFHEEGLLSRRVFIEAGRSELVAKYSGHTAIKVRRLFQKAMGGVLFIDEAYSLLEDQNGGFADEALNTIVAEMENRRHDLTVILAGYPEKMEALLRQNPGLRSRIAFTVQFPDYTGDELYSIAEKIAEANGYRLASDVYARLRPIFDQALKTTDFGNGRFARTMVEQAQLSKALAAVGQDSSLDFDDELFILGAADFTVPDHIHAGPERRAIGFEI